MAILRCDNCGFNKKVPDGYVDKKVRCPQCETVNVILAEAEDLHLDDVVEQLAEPTQDSPAHSRHDISENELIGPAEVRPALAEGGLFKNLLAGSATGILNVLFAISLAVLIFSMAPLRGNLPHAVSMALVSAIIIGLFAAMQSRMGFNISGPESLTAVVLFLLVQSIHEQMIQRAIPSSEFYPTVLGAVAICSAATGLTLYITGLLKRGHFLRFIPMQVVGGTLAGVGAMILWQSFGLAMGQSVCLKDLLQQAFELDYCLRWAPAMGLGLLLFLLVRFTRNAYGVLLLLIAAVGGAHWYLHTQGIGLLQARAEGWLFSGFEPDLYWTTIYSQKFVSSIRWDIILDQTGYIAALAGLVLASTMVRIAKLEITLGRQVDQDNEFRALGLGNLLSAVAGGMPGELCLDRSLGSRSAGGKGPLAGYIAVAIGIAALVLVHRYLAYLPRFVPAGIIAGLGLSLLWRWIVDSRKRFSGHGDYAQLLLVFLITVGFGLLLGLGVGAGLAMLLTALRYGSVSVVRLEMSGSHYHSNVDRAPVQIAVLRTKGDSIYAMALQGFMFLGTTDHLLTKISNRVKDTDREPLRFVLMDFTHISGLDSSVAISFIQLKQLAKHHGFTLVFTNVPFELESQLSQAGCKLNDPEEGSTTVTSMDYAMEWAEDHILDEADVLDVEEQPLAKLLGPVFPEPEVIPTLLKVLKRIEVKEGRPIFAQGSPSDSMYFIESGFVNVELDLDGGKRMRLKKMGPGTVFGEMGLYTSAPRTASVIAAEDCVIYRLSSRVMQMLQAKHTPLASAIHRFVVTLLADRVASANTTLQNVLK